ncbi:MAG: hypothetical protein AABZ60_10750 [Planctomycetota bacterium]
MQASNYPERPFLEFNYSHSSPDENQRYSTSYSESQVGERELMQSQQDVYRFRNAVSQLELRVEDLENEVTELRRQLEHKQLEIQQLQQLQPKIETKTGTDLARKEAIENSSILAKSSCFDSNTCF